MLVQKKIESSGDGKDESDGGGGRNRREGLIVVTASALRVATGGKTGLVAYDDVVFVAFQFEDPFCLYWNGAWWHFRAFDDFPCFAVLQGVELGFDGLVPMGAVRAGGSLMEGDGADRRRARVGYGAPHSMIVGEVRGGNEGWDVTAGVGVPTTSTGGSAAWTPDGGYLLRWGFAWLWEGGSGDHG